MSIRPPPPLNGISSTTTSSMLQRSKSAGKQPARQQGYAPLPSQELASGSGPKMNRQMSPGQDLQKRPPVIKRTIAPGQVSACFDAKGKSMLFCGSCLAILDADCVAEELLFLSQPAPGARSKEKFVSLPEELEELELPPPQLEVPPALFEVSWQV